MLTIAVLARVWDLTGYPAGLYPDQAANGEDALSILEGDWRVFFPRNNGREGLFLYVQALTVGLFGVGTWQLFLGSALVGIATVGVTYLAAARLFGTMPGLLAGVFLATNPWHVTLSRTGFRAVTVPLFIALTVWLAGRFLAGTGRPQSRDAVLAGIAAGLSTYTYTASRAFVLFLALWALTMGIRVLVRRDFRARVRPLVRPVMLAIITAVVVATPLALFFARHPEFATVRAQHVSIFNPDLNQGNPFGTFQATTGKTLRAFIWDGDGNPRHNVSLPGSTHYRPGGIHHYAGGGAPFLSLFPVLLGMVGAVVAVRRAPWLLGLFVVMLLPAIATAEGIPHGLRTVGAIPAHVWLAGLGGAWLLDLAGRYARPAVFRVVGAAAVAALALTAVTDLWLYFGIARNAPLAQYEYRADLTEVSKYVGDRAVGSARLAEGRTLPYLVLDAFSEQTVHFLTTSTGHPYRRVQPERSHEIGLAPGEELVFTQSSLPDAVRYRAAHPDVRVMAVKRNRFNEVILVVLRR